MAEIIRMRNEELKRTAKSIAEQFGVPQLHRPDGRRHGRCQNGGRRGGVGEDKGNSLRGDCGHLHVKRAPKS